MNRAILNYGRHKSIFMKVIWWRRSVAQKNFDFGTAKLFLSPKAKRDRCFHINCGHMQSALAFILIELLFFLICFKHLLAFSPSPLSMNTSPLIYCFGYLSALFQLFSSMEPLKYGHTMRICCFEAARKFFGDSTDMLMTCVPNLVVNNFNSFLSNSFLVSLAECIKIANHNCINYINDRAGTNSYNQLLDFHRQ